MSSGSLLEIHLAGFVDTLFGHLVSLHRGLYSPRALENVQKSEQNYIL